MVGFACGSDQRLARAKASNDRGNDLFNENKFRQASFHYRKACFVLMECFPRGELFPYDSFINMLARRRHYRVRKIPSNEYIKAAANIYGAASNNLALIDLLYSRFQEAIERTTVVLGLPGMEENKKALMRRARAYIEIKEIEKAEKDLNTIAGFDKRDNTPTDAAVVAMRREIMAKKRIT